jgi:hypothetical protein
MRRMSRRKVVVWSVAGSLLVFACSAFDGGDSSEVVPPPPEAGASDAVTPPDPTDASDAGAVGLLPCGAPLPVAELFATASAPARFVATDGAHVYWAAGTTTIERKGVSDVAVEKVWTMPYSINALGLVQDYVVVVTTNTYAVAKAADAGSAAHVGNSLDRLATYDTAAFGWSSGKIHRGIPLASYNPIALVETTSAIAANGTDVFFVSPAGDAGPGRAVFAVNNSAGQKEARVAYYSADLDPSELAVDVTDMFLLDRGRGVVVRASGNPGVSPATLLADGEPELGDIAVRDTHVYYSTSSGIRRVAKDATGCKLSLSDQPASNIAVSAQHVYYASGANIMRVPR